MKRRMITGRNGRANTLLLLHGDKYADEITGRNPVFRGNTSLSNTGKFGKSFYFPNLSGRDGLCYDVKLDTSKPFTIDFWAKAEVKSGPCTMFVGSLRGALQMRIYSGRLNILRAFVTDLTSYSLPDNIQRDCHYATIGNGSKIKFYQNGKLIGSVGATQFATSNAINIGCYFTTEGGSSENWLGNISEFRISDIARWTSDFTPPTKPY